MPTEGPVCGWDAAVIARGPMATGEVGIRRKVGTDEDPVAAAIGSV